MKRWQGREWRDHKGLHERRVLSTRIDGGSVCQAAIQEAITFLKEDNQPSKNTRYIMTLVCRSSMGQNIKMNASLQHHSALGTTLCCLRHLKCACSRACKLPYLL